MSDQFWSPADVPIDRPNVARFYDYLLGGYHNFESDRLLAEKMLKLVPDLRLVAQVNRGFLRRVVTFMVEQGIDQFLDLGSGIPTVGNVHEVAQALNPAVRVVYVDIEPTAVVHSQAMLRNNPQATAVLADARRPRDILDHEKVRALLDFERPLGLLMVALLHYFLDDDDAYRAVGTLREALAPGSYMAVAHTTRAQRRAAISKEALETLRTSRETQPRSVEQVQPFFGDWEMLPPGLVLTPLWRPESPQDLYVDDPERGCTLAGVARKPGAA